MPELRQNPFTKQWVIIATERAKRPHDFVRKNDNPVTIPSYVANCPFCPGNEHLTPGESHSVHRNGKWQVRVVPNKFSALSSEGELSRMVDGLKRTVNGVGIHEVVVETPDHSQTTALLSEQDIEMIVRSYKDRYFAITDDTRVEHVTIFKNHGTSAGTSLEHPHSQIIATPIIPPDIRTRMEVALRFYDEHGKCIFCKVLMDELAEQVRIVHETQHFVCLVPFASLTPFSLWIFPRRHMASFGEIQPEEMLDLARMLRIVLAKIYNGLANPDFNYVVRTAPGENRYSRYYHWYVSVIPRLTKVAGFELGSGMFINPTIPETNARFLREVDVSNL
ncbi:MAG: galactose-1-phosphate uridylyltransferase [Acidobacteria bacterium RIFCSPLOWO2_12_FULL_54_10]|nr:MAG: galactose-1-phosphate uridylyltransferase [Acidobacteria bacterium RIFCSPLOWO2_12_FULL_54_10]